jgi:hypothetical protein
MSIKQHLLFAIYMCIMLLISSRASVDLIAYDGFSTEDYVIPETIGDHTEGLRNVNGGVGWSSGWTIYASQYLRPGRIHAAEPGLEYPGLATHGYRAYWNSGTDNRLGRAHSATRKISNSLIGGYDGDTIWLSILYVRKVSSSSSVPGSIALMSNSVDVVRLNLSNIKIQEAWELSLNGGDYVQYPVQATSTGITGLVLVRIDYKDGDDDVYLWSGDSIDISSEPSISTALKASAPLPGFNTFQLIGGNYTDTSYDEIRIARTFPAVIGYKPPGSLVIIQ